MTRSTLALTGCFTLALLLLSGCGSNSSKKAAPTGTAPAAGQASSARPSAAVATPAPELAGVAVIPSQGNLHVNAGQSHVAYSTDPPTSGPHFTTVPQPQIYKDPLATEFLPHFMEHAGVEILYNKDAPADVVAKLKDIYRQEVDKTNVGVGPHLLMAPRPDMPCEVTVTSWQRITAWGGGCNQPGAVGHDFSLKGTADIDKLKSFIERNYCQYDPENTCGNGAKGGPINNSPATPKPGEATVQALLGTATPGATPAASPTAPVGPLAPATPAP